MPSLFRRPVPAGLSFALAACAAGAASAQQAHSWEMNFQPAATVIMEHVRSFHWFLLAIITVIVLLVMALLAVCIVRFNQRSNPIPSKTSHNALIEVVWTVVPVLILVLIAIPSFRLLFEQSVIPKQIDLTVKATGHQWYWSYEYPDNGNFSFDSLMKQANELKPGEPRLLAVDNEMVVPVGKTVRLLTTGADVIHAFGVPSFGITIDSIPGRINEAWFRIERPGVYYGQCRELCGKDHAFMPIAVRAVPEDEFARWADEAKQKFGAAAPATAIAANDR